MIISGLALAQPSEQQHAIAKFAYLKAMSAMRQGKYSEACAQLQGSQGLQQANGTKYQLAKCLEEAGKVTSAWSLYLEVAGSANRNGDRVREKTAGDAAKRLQGDLPQMEVRISDKTSSLSGLRVTIDDHIELPRSLLNFSFPVDPGTHRVKVTATNYEAWESSSKEVRKGRKLSFDVPALKRSPQPPPSPSTPSPTPEPDPSIINNIGVNNNVTVSASGLTGAIMIPIGLVTFASGVFVGYLGKNQYDGADCDQDNLCSTKGLETTKDALRKGEIGTAIGGAGLAFVAIGIAVPIIAAVTTDAKEVTDDTKPKRMQSSRVWLEAGMGTIGLRGQW